MVLSSCCRKSPTKDMTVRKVKEPVLLRSREMKRLKAEIWSSETGGAKPWACAMPAVFPISDLS